MMVKNGIEGSFTCYDSKDAKYTQLDHIRFYVAGHIAKFIHDYNTPPTISVPAEVYPASPEKYCEVSSIGSQPRKVEE